MPPRIAAECKVRCVTAAAEIANIMRQISHLDLAAVRCSPFTRIGEHPTDTGADERFRAILPLRGGSRLCTIPKGSIK